MSDHRQISLTFIHPTIGDDVFAPLVAAAAREFFAHDPAGTLTEYSASNGVHIQVVDHV